MIEIAVFKKVDFSGYTFIEGFPGAGLVGPMSIGYMISKLGMEYVGFVKGDAFPPIVSIHDDMPLPPARLYWSSKYKIVALFTEAAPVSENAVYNLSEEIYKFVQDRKFSQIISISGIPVEKSNNQDVFAVASTKALVDRVAKAGLKKVGEGVAAGISALLIMHSSLDEMDDINVLVPVNPEIIDPAYAELALKSLNKLLGLDIDVSELEEEAKLVESKIRDLLKSSKDAKGLYPKDEGPPAFA